MVQRLIGFVVVVLEFLLQIVRYMVLEFILPCLSKLLKIVFNVCKWFAVWMIRKAINFNCYLIGQSETKVLVTHGIKTIKFTFVKLIQCIVRNSIGFIIVLGYFFGYIFMSMLIKFGCLIKRRRI